MLFCELISKTGIYHYPHLEVCCRLGFSPCCPYTDPWKKSLLPPGMARHHLNSFFKISWSLGITWGIVFPSLCWPLGCWGPNLCTSSCVMGFDTCLTWYCFLIFSCLLPFSLLKFSAPNPFWNKGKKKSNKSLNNLFVSTFVEIR